MKIPMYMYFYHYQAHDHLVYNCWAAQAEQIQRHCELTVPELLDRKTTGHVLKINDLKKFQRYTATWQFDHQNQEICYLSYYQNAIDQKYYLNYHLAFTINQAIASLNALQQHEFMHQPFQTTGVLPMTGSQLNQLRILTQN